MSEPDNQAPSQADAHQEHPVDVLLALRALIDDIGDGVNSSAAEAQCSAITWILDKCEEQAFVLAMLRNADSTLEHSTDLAARLEAQQTKQRIYDEIDRANQ